MMLPAIDTDRPRKMAFSGFDALAGFAGLEVVDLQVTFAIDADLGYGENFWLRETVGCRIGAMLMVVVGKPLLWRRRHSRTCLNNTKQWTYDGGAKDEWK